MIGDEIEYEGMREWCERVMEDVKDLIRYLVDSTKEVYMIKIRDTEMENIGPSRGSVRSK